MNSPREDAGATPLEQALKSFPFSRTQQLQLLLCNYIQLAHVLLVAGVVLVPWAPIWLRLVAGVLVLYLLPALGVRAVLTVSRLQEGRIPLSESGYFTWWLLVNMQMVFNRFPALEEALRLVPTLYSNWLRLFGARIGRFTYWAAGTRILDRSFLEIGDGVVFGAGTRISPHLVVRNSEGELELCLASVKIGDRAIIGGYSALAAGTEIAADECTRACLLSPPFSTWSGGRRVSKDNREGA